MAVQLRNIFDFLKHQNYNCNFDASEEVITINVDINSYNIRLICQFPLGFPYVFPKLYLDDESMDQVYPIPHVGQNGSICIFDKEKSFPNPNQPKKVVLKSVEQSIQIIKDGIEKNNIEDFKKEFKAYWRSNNMLKAFTLFAPGNSPQRLYYFGHKKRIFIADNKSQLAGWLKYKFNSKINLSDFREGLFLPLEDIGPPLYPKTNKEIYIKLKESKYFDKYCEFIKDSQESNLIVFSQKVENSICLAGWLHRPFKTPDGFRKGKIYPKFVLQGTASDEEIIYLDIESLNRRRLFYRGGAGEKLPNIKVSITGCGSIGSFLIENLLRLGIDDFILIDNDVLTSENIARHICGASQIGMPKVKAIKEKLIKGYPYLECQKINTDVYELFNNNTLEIFNESDFNFVVVGNKSMEFKFNKLFMEQSIQKPIIIIWVEPFILGGHAVILQNYKRGYKSLYDDELRFKYSVLEDGSKFLRKESGCQSTFIPYSAFEIQSFIQSFLDYFNNNFIQGNKEGNHLISWGGKLSEARKNNYRLNDKWLSKDDKTLIVERLD